MEVNEAAFHSKWGTDLLFISVLYTVWMLSFVLEKKRGNKNSWNKFCQNHVMMDIWIFLVNSNCLLSTDIFDFLSNLKTLKTEKQFSPENQNFLIKIFWFGYAIVVSHGSCSSSASSSQVQFKSHNTLWLGIPIIHYLPSPSLIHYKGYIQFRRVGFSGASPCQTVLCTWNGNLHQLAGIAGQIWVCLRQPGHMSTLHIWNFSLAW